MVQFSSQTLQGEFKICIGLLSRKEKLLFFVYHRGLSVKSFYFTWSLSILILIIFKWFVI